MKTTTTTTTTTKTTRCVKHTVRPSFALRFADRKDIIAPEKRNPNRGVSSRKQIRQTSNAFRFCFVPATGKPPLKKTETDNNNHNSYDRF